MHKPRESRKREERKKNLPPRDVSTPKLHEIPKNQKQFLETFTTDAKAVSCSEWIKLWTKAWVKFSVPKVLTKKNTSDGKQFCSACSSESKFSSENVLTTLCEYINKVCSPQFVIFHFSEIFRNFLHKFLTESQREIIGIPKRENRKTINNWLMEKFNSTLMHLEELFVGSLHNLVPKYETNDFQYYRIS